MVTRTIYTTPYAIWKSRSGTVYTADADGVLANVPVSDALDFVKGGCSYSQIDPIGIPNAPVGATDFVTAAGTFLGSTSAAGTHYISSTPGTGLYLLGEAANANTKTDVSYIEYVVPPSFIDGDAITATVNAQTKGTGTASVETVAVSAYRVAPNGTQGANLVSTAAQTISGAAAAYAFTIAGATLNPGDRLFIGVTTVITETAGVNLQAQINSLTLS